MEFALRWNRKLFLELPDPRMRELPLLGNPARVVLLTGAWLYFVLRAGPRYMADRKPMDLRRLVQCINLLQIIANTFLVYELCTGGWLTGELSWMGCQDVDYSRSPAALRLSRAVYLYFLLKIVDLADTVIFVLRRKDRQISFLHVYHHVVTLSLSWLVANYVPGGQFTQAGLLNSLVHVVMYVYYFLAALGPQYQKYLWWKRYLTQFQLVQFAIQLAHATNLVVRQCPCARPLVYTGFFVVVSFLYLFTDFYIKSYRKSGTKHKSL